MNRTYRGQPADFTARIAFAERGAIEIDLIQPLDGESNWTDYLAERGPGLYHIRRNVADIEAIAKYLAE